MEVRKVAAVAPGARIMCRILVSSAGADWPLSMKFGCSPALARDNLLRARDLGLVPYGVSFHVGSQQRDPGQWDLAVAKVAALFAELNAFGIGLRLVNLGGGLPASYVGGVPAIREYAQAIMLAMTRHFGNHLPEMIMEPGRYMCGDAGILQSEVVLVARKEATDRRRWVYLDVGKFGGLAETMNESIKYRIRTSRDGGRTGPVVLAGPTCDEADVLYEKALYELPLDLTEGDRVEFLSAGAYTTTYASIGFNGFPPLKAYYI
jgi:ornithine decarboxylase